MTKIKQLLRHRTGDSSVEFIFVSAALLFLFATLVTALVYVMAYYNAAFVARRVVRDIEVAGQYNATEVQTMLDANGASNLENLSVSVNADYFSETKIQLRDTFAVSLHAEYPIGILTFGEDTVYMMLPINVRLKGMSEVYWK